MSNARTLANTINSSSEIVVPSGGVNFGTSTDGTGTVTGGVLDDYETGSWTPSFNNVSLGNGSVSGTYRKIGSQVFVTANYVHGSSSIISGSVSISNLPFTASTFTFTGTGYANYPGVDAFLIRCLVTSSSTSLLLQLFSSAARPVGGTSPTNMVTTGSLSVQITYLVS